jgi:hypothetical protein
VYNQFMNTRIKIPGTNLPTKPPKIGEESSFLVEASKTMDRQRRFKEQEGEMRFGRVDARDHPEQEVMSQSSELEQGPLPHPELEDNPRFAGLDSPLALPRENTEARRKHDRERRNQEQEKQNRLTYVPGFNPKPRGPRG